MSIDLVFCGLHEPYIIPWAVLLSVRIGVGSWGCPSSSSVLRSGTASLALMKSPPSSASAAEDMTRRIILAIMCIG